jgi:ATP-dependent helicase HrpB
LGKDRLQIRFDRQITEMLNRGTHRRDSHSATANDADLRGVGLIIFDEFHERSIHADLALAICPDLCQLRRSASTGHVGDAGCFEVARLLGNVPIITGEGQSHEVQIFGRPAGGNQRNTVAGIRLAIAEQPGDILVFLPVPAKSRYIDS